MGVNTQVDLPALRKLSSIFGLQSDEVGFGPWRACTLTPWPDLITLCSQLRCKVWPLLVHDNRDCQQCYDLRATCV